ncbi:MAG: hypothetical protein ACRD4Y_00880 [Candidatus Acidiferrales bacterium]
MRSKQDIRSSLISIITLTSAILLLPCLSHAQAISKTGMAGSYSVTLKVLPAEAFHGPKAEMARDSGAEPNFLNSAEHPNHHLVVFVKDDGKPVEDATLSIEYRQTSSKMDKWESLPVVRMHVVGKSMATTHYGNNINLPSGNYEVRVTVDGKGLATFRFALPS